MKQSVVFLTTIFVGLSTQAKPTIDFSCPADGTHRSMDQMYSAMQIGQIYGHADSTEGQIVFVDEQKELSDDKGQLTSIGKTFVNRSTGRVDFRGTFKIGYDYSAKECRRQIVLEKEIGPGVWEGHTAIEICNPEIKSIFAKVQGKSFDDIWKVLSPMATKLQNEYDKKSETLNASDGVCYQVWDNKTNKYVNGKNYNSDACDKANMELTALSDKASKLQSLEIVDYAKPYVDYFKDENGIVLPRFKVKSKEIFFRRMSLNVYDASGKEKQAKSCSMNILHGVDYAGLANQYTWQFLYETSLTINTWTFDKTNQSVLSKSYRQAIRDYRFTDVNDSYFYQMATYGN